MPQAVIAFVTKIGFAAANALGMFAGGAVVAQSTIYALGGAIIAGSALVAKKVMTLFEIEMPKIDTDRSRQSTVRSTTEPHKIIYGETLVSGPIVYANVAGTDNKHLYHAIALAAHEVEAITDIYLDNELIANADIAATTTTAATSGRVTGSGTFAAIDGTTICHINKHLGTSTQAADSLLRDAFSSTWTTSHQGKGIAYIVTKFVLNDDSAEVWDKYAPNNIKAVVKGRKIYDPRLDSTQTDISGSGSHRLADSTTWEYSTNPALAVADYLMNADFGLGVSSSKIDWTAIKTAADACDASVSVPGGTESRFTCNGVLFGTDSHKTNINKLLSAMNGNMAYIDGYYVVRAGIYEAHVLDLDEDDLAGSIGIKTSLERSDRFNTIKGVFIDPSSNYKSTEFPKVQLSSAYNRDNQEELHKEVALNMTNSSFMAQRIAHKLIQQSNHQKIVTYPTNMKGLRVAVGDRVRITNTELGWTNKVYQCVQWSFNEEGGVTLTLREDAQANYADPTVTPNNEYSEITSDGTLTDAFRGVPAPSGLRAVSAEGKVFLDWVNPGIPQEFQTVHVLVSSDSNLSNAVKAGETDGTQFVHDSDNAATNATKYADGDTRYYWVRAVNFVGTSAQAQSSAHGSVSVTVTSAVDWNNVADSATIGIQLDTDDSISIVTDDTPSTSGSAIATSGIEQDIVITQGGVTVDGGGAIRSDGRSNVDFSSGSAGFFLGYDSTAYKFGVGNSSENMVWNGSNLNVTGGITATSGTFAGSVNVNANGKMYGGSMTQFNTGAGFFLGYHTDAYKFSVGNASGKILTWDGSDLNVQANAVSFTTGGAPDYDSNSRFPTSMRSSVLDLGSNTDYVFFDNKFDQNLTLFAGFYAGPLTSGSISGESNAQNAIMAQLSLQIQYAPNNSGTPGTWTNFGSAALSSKKFTATQLNSNYYVKTTNLGGGNYRADLATASQAATDFTGLGYSEFAYGITDEDYYLTERVTVYGFPKGEYFLRVVVTVTDGTYSPYPATGSPSLTNNRRLSIPNALTYTDSDHGTSAVSIGNSLTYFTSANDNQTLIDGGSISLMPPEENATSNKYAGIFIGGRGETSDANSIQPLGGIWFYEGMDDMGSGPGDDGSPDFAIYMPPEGGNLLIGGNVNFNDNVDVDGTLSINGVTVNAGAVTGPAGSDGQIQYNNGGALGGSSNLTFNDTTNTLSVTNLTVSGTTTTIDTTNLNVSDKNITLNYGTGDTSANADGAGITIQDAVNSSTDATILWSTSSDTFDFSHGATFAGDTSVYTGTTSGSFNVGRSSNERLNFYVSDSQGYIRYYQDETGTTNHSVNFQIISSSTGTNQFYFNKGVNVTGDLTAAKILPDQIRLADISTSTPVNQSLFGIYAWDTELQFTSRNISTGAFVASMLTLDWSTNAATFAGSGTFNGGSLTVSSGTSSNALLIIEADTDNNNESDLPGIQLKADGGIIEGTIRLNDNALQIINNVSGGGIEFLTGTTLNYGTDDPATGATTALTIDNSQNVGLGTVSPAFRLHTYHPTTNVVARFESGDAEVWIDLHDSNSGGYGALLGHTSTELFKVADHGVNVRMSLSPTGLLDTDAGYSVAGTTAIDSGRNATLGAIQATKAASDQTQSPDSGSIPSTSGAEVLRIAGNYTNGQYTHELAKIDRVGNLPLYLRESRGTANSFTNLVRFGSHSVTNGGTYQSDTVHVFGDLGATGKIRATAQLEAATHIQAGTNIGVANTSSTTQYGLSLYGGPATSPTYGIMFTGTPGAGTHGDVTGNWATYFNMNSSAGRGWVFRDVSTPANVASITNTGYAQFNNAVTADAFVAKPANTNGYGALRISNPGGAERYSRSGHETGAIKITLPQSWTSTMMRMTIEIYDYAGDESFTVKCGGYTYASGSEWVNTTATIIGSGKTDRNFTVRFGHDGSKCAIYIGETTSVWTHSQIVVTDFTAGFSNAQESKWRNGWDISLVTSLGTITKTHNNNDISENSRLLRVGGTQIVSTDRNLQNIGSGTYKGYFGSASFSWAGSTNYPTLYGSNSDRWVMLAFPHIPYLQNGQRGFTGTTRGAVIRYEGAISSATNYDAGVISEVTSNAWSIKQSSITSADPAFVAKQHSAHQIDVSVGKLSYPWSTSNRSTFNIVGNTTSLLGLTQKGGTNLGYIYGYSTGMEVLSYNDLNLYAGATSAHGLQVLVSDDAVNIISRNFQGNDKEVFDFNDGYLRMNENSSFGNGIWTGSSKIQSATTEWALGSSGTSSTARIRMISGAYNGSNVIKLDGSDGKITATDFVFGASTTKTAQPVYRQTVSGISSAGYTNICNVSGNGLASGVQCSFTGTTSSVVVNVTAEILANHYQDIIIKSTAGFYTTLYLRVISNGNEDFSIQAKTNSANSLSMNCEIRPLSNEGITFSTTADYSTITLDHTCHFGISHSSTGGAYTHYRTDGDIWLYNNQSGSSHSSDLHIPRNGFITFYGNGSDYHGIGSRQWNGSATDDLRINSYAEVNINLDSNSNNTTNANFNIGRHGGGTGTMDFLLTVSGENGDLVTEGNVTAYGSPSDIRLKESIEVIPDALSKVSRLRGVTFKYKKDGSRSTGLIAQELQEVLPEVVYTTEDIKTKEEHLAVRYGNVAGLLVESIKTLKKESDELRAMLAQIMEKLDGDH